MRRSASEIIHNLEMRVARLEKQSRRKVQRRGPIRTLEQVIQNIVQFNKIEILSEFRSKHLGDKVQAPHPNDVRDAISRNKKIMVHSRDGGVYKLNWRWIG